MSDHPTLQQRISEYAFHREVCMNRYFGQRCSTCDRLRAFAEEAAPLDRTRVPEWVRRAAQGTLVAKDMTG